MIQFTNTWVENPLRYDEQRNKIPVYPQDARICGFTYESCVYTDIIQNVVNTKGQILSSQVHTNVLLFKIPTMIKSVRCNLFQATRGEKTTARDECPNDTGGYFIIKGQERVIVAHEYITLNQVYIYQDKKNTKYNLIAEIRSLKEYSDYSTTLQIKLDHQDNIFAELNGVVSQDIPIGILLKALGIFSEDVKEIIGEEVLSDTHDKITQEDALGWIGNRLCVGDKLRVSDGHVKMVLGEIIPHLGISRTLKERGIFILLMLKKLLATGKGKRALDDRDNINNKRVDATGDLIGKLVKSLFRVSLKYIQQHVEKTEEINLLNIINKHSITLKLYHCFTTGKWGVPKSNYIRQGVCQLLHRLSYVGFISHLRRLIIPIKKDSKNTQVRQLNCSSLGFTCPIETPEGASSGIIKNFSIMVKISTGIDTVQIQDILFRLFPEIFCGESQATEGEGEERVFIMLNNIFIGSLEKKKQTPRMLELLKKYRDINILPKSVSISFNPTDNEIVILSDSGRMLRAVFKFSENLSTEIQFYKETETEVDLWNVLEAKGIIQYIDGAEAESSNILGEPENYDPRVKWDYAEIHPCVMLGICASITPFPDHSQAPRNIYGSAMMKQAIGLPHVNYLKRFDTNSHVLDYPQKKLVYTHVEKCTPVADMPSGINVIVAIMCYTGFNMEDSIIINQSAVDRGLFCSTSYKVVSTCESKKGTHDTEIIQIPDKNIQKYIYNYSKLDPDGIIGVGQQVKENDVLVGKIFNNGDTHSDCSLICKSAETGIIDKISISPNEKGYKQVKIRIRNIHRPEIGDKCASQHAQKGTIGMLYRQEDMPFNHDGICPDVIMNTHAIPSRMTINMLLEILTGKKCVVGGEVSDTFQDATAFCHDGEDLIRNAQKVLVENGYDGMGEEIMFNGMTGERLKAKIFMGPCYYQKLNHLVSNKIHTRARGQVHQISRQPCSGRSRDGGFRFGEMEKDCMISHGTSAFLKERLFDMSDPYNIDVCDACGAMTNKENECTMCDGDETMRTNIPYACKLLFQELQAMGIKININQ
jgi:DNA-directed RNA polymerase II subunit RPB2